MSIGHIWSSIITKSVHGEPRQEPIVRNDCLRLNRPFMIVALEGGYVPVVVIQAALQSGREPMNERLKSADAMRALSVRNWVVTATSCRRATPFADVHRSAKQPYGDLRRLRFEPEDEWHALLIRHARCVDRRMRLRRSARYEPLCTPACEASRTSVSRRVARVSCLGDRECGKWPGGARRRDIGRRHLRPCPYELSARVADVSRRAMQISGLSPSWRLHGTDGRFWVPS